MSDHAIFNLVFDLKGTPQVPSILRGNKDTRLNTGTVIEGDEDPISGLITMSKAGSLPILSQQ